MGAPLKNKKEVQAFLGVAGFHRIFVRDLQ